MKKIKITVSTLMSFMLISSSLISCNSNGITNNDEDTINTEYSAREANNDWYSYIEANNVELNKKIDSGFHQEDLEQMLSDFGYEKDELSLEQFNKIYSDILNFNDGKIDFDKVYYEFFSDRSDFFVHSLQSILKNTPIDSEIGSKDWEALNTVDQNLLMGLNNFIKAYPNDVKSETTASRVGGSFTFLSVEVDLGDNATVIAFYTIVGAGVGGIIGGWPGAAIGAGIGAVVGVVMSAIK